MNEMKKTMMFAGAALVLAFLAIVTSPGKKTPAAFVDQGEQFFPEFSDPNTATSLEVVKFNEETGEAIPFKVVFSGGKWTIPSHYDYPADGKERLAKTAAGVIGIRKDDFRSDNPADQVACGVVDPLDESTTELKGRGQRVTIKGENEQVLADFIVGNKVPEREGFRFVRVPGQKRIYAVKMDIDISTKFSDWIESDLLKVDKDKIDKVVLKDYSINERSGVVTNRDVLILSKDGEAWKANRMGADEEVNKTKKDELLKALDELKIVGVRPKPAGLSQSLQKEGNEMEISTEDYLSLRNRGFYFSRDGSLLSNEGEVEVSTTEGVEYTLRFGEVAYGSGLEVSAGSDSVDSQGGAPADNRYLFITTRFNEKQFKEPPAPANTDFLGKPDSVLTEGDRRAKAVYEAHEEWKKKVEHGRQLSDELNSRFADWYYVISDVSFKKLHLTRKDLIEKKKTKK